MVIAIIGILSGVIYVNFGASQAQSRDLDRRNDIRQVEIALENYRRDNGRYPLGCNPIFGGVSTSGQPGSSEACTSGSEFYIQNLVPGYITELPVDSRAPAGGGYVYITNNDGSVYKFIAKGSIESQVIQIDDDFASCDYRPSGSGSIRSAGWCAFAESDSLPDRCTPGNDRFDTSIATWSGFAAEADIDTAWLSLSGADRDAARETMRVICW